MTTMSSPTTTTTKPMMNASSRNSNRNSSSLTSLGRRQLLRQMDGGGRPSMCVQNIEAMGSVFWNQTHEIKALDESEIRKSKFESTDFVHELKLFLELAATTALMYLGFAMSPLITASYVGRLYGPVYLSAFTLANLMGNLCTQTLVTGLFGAIDTLSPQALGKGEYNEVGYLAIRGVICSVILLVPINIILIMYLKDILVALGEDEEASNYANEWYNIFVWSLPFSILYGSLCKFCTVQRIMKPVIIVSLLSTALIAPTLRLCCHWWGFIGTAIAYVINWICQAMFLLGYVCYKKPHDKRTWPIEEDGGYNSLIKKAMFDTVNLNLFISLGLGGVIAQSEWVFWEALGLIVGKLGIIAMSVHTIPNQIVMNVSTIPIAFGIALAVRMGISLPSSVRRTQYIAIIVTSISIVIFGFVAILLYVYRSFFITIFVNNDGSGTDKAVYDLAEEIWPLVSFYNLNIALFGLLAGISSGLGKQWDLGVINVFWLWCFGMPIIYYTTIVKENGSLNDAWFWMNISYIGINGTLILVFVCSDWYKIQDQIFDQDDDDNENEDNKDGVIIVVQQQSNNMATSKPATETTSLL